MRRRRNFVFFISIFIVFISNTVFTQTVSLESLVPNPGDDILVSMDITGFDDVGSISIFIEFDSDVVTYNGITNVVPEGSGTIPFVSPGPGSISILGLSWIAPGSAGVNFPDGKYLDIDFTYNNGYTDLIFGSSCEVTDFDVNPLDVTYFDGSVGTPVKTLLLNLFLEGCYIPTNGNGMRTDLADVGLIPLAQPFDPSLPYYGNSSPDWYYTGSENTLSLPAGTVDWILVQVRDALSANDANESTIEAQQACLLKSDGTVVALNGNPPEFSATIDEGMFIMVFHRNHLGILSASAAQETSPGVFSYDFTTGSDKVFGGNTGYSFLETGVWGMTAGDINGDQTVNELDKTAGWETEAGVSGYYGTDTDLDGQVDNPDKNDQIIKNSSKSSAIPN